MGKKAEDGMGEEMRMEEHELIELRGDEGSVKEEEKIRGEKEARGKKPRETSPSADNVSPAAANVPVRGTKRTLSSVSSGGGSLVGFNASASFKRQRVAFSRNNVFGKTVSPTALKWGRTNPIVENLDSILENSILDITPPLGASHNLNPVHALNFSNTLFSDARAFPPLFISSIGIDSRFVGKCGSCMIKNTAHNFSDPYNFVLFGDQSIPPLCGSGKDRTGQCIPTIVIQGCRTGDVRDFLHCLFQEKNRVGLRPPPQSTFFTLAQQT